MIQLLIERLKGIAYPLVMPDDLTRKLTDIAKCRFFEPGDYILRKGQVCSGAYFLAKGLARSYYIRENKQITSRLMEENFIITSWQSFYKQQPSNEYIITIEESATIFLNFRDIIALYEEYPVFNVIGRKQAEISFYEAEARTQMLRGLSAIERYKFFCENYSSLLQRVPLKHIASYLSMSDETLSRIRSKYKPLHDIS